MRPPSSAGNGIILSTPRLTDNKAIKSQIIIGGTSRSTIETNALPTPIGHESIFFASVRSSGVDGKSNEPSVLPRSLKVITEVA